MSTTTVDFPGGYLKPAIYSGLIGAVVGSLVFKEGIMSKQNLMDAGALAAANVIGNYVAFEYMPATRLGMDDARIFPGLLGAAAYTGWESYRGHGDLGKNAGVGVVACVGGNMLAIDKDTAKTAFASQVAKKKAEAAAKAAAAAAAAAGN
ncbi:MAG: hypothetical protein BWY99_01466 [Synergistetes bacterium ADurb.BinA166]|nr:MAG: hypothetical protein BWY99_01466 [Synergistetes bacterium ADurb.BinA166]